MDKAGQTMIDNLEKNYGKSLEQWIRIVEKEKLTRHGEIISFLKNEHNLTHGYANLIAHYTLKSSSITKELEDLLCAQYQGKEHFLPLYRELLKHIGTFGDDFQVLPRKTYVSLKRSKQFALLIPATKSRFEIGLFLKAPPYSDLLKAEKPGSMCSHKLHLQGSEDITPEVLNLIKQSYDSSR